MLLQNKNHIKYMDLSMFKHTVAAINIITSIENDKKKSHLLARRPPRTIIKTEQNSLKQC